jgi:hypothetical protein
MLEPEHTSANDGTIILQPTDNRFVPSIFIAEDYNAVVPVPVDEPTYDNLRYIISSNTFNINMTTDVLSNIAEACELLFGHTDTVIGEVGLCSTVDTERIVDTPHGPYTYKESANAQLLYTVKKTIQLADVNGHIEQKTLSIDIGGMENVIVPNIVREVAEWRPG